jgi:hypothetical protein
MAEAELRVGTTTTDWSAETLVAGDVTDSFWYKRVGGDKLLKLKLTFSAVPTAVNIVIEHSVGGVIWNTVQTITSIGLQRTLYIPAPSQGFIRARCVSFTGVFTTTLTWDLQNELFDSAGRLELRSSSTGDTQNIYNRLYINVAAQSGNALRSFASVQDVAANTVRGAHISLSFGTSGTITGLGAAIEATVHIPSGGGMAGTVTALNLAMNSDGTGSDPAGVTELSYIRFVNQGDATGGVDVDDDVFLFSIQGHTEGTGNLVYDITDGAALPSNGSIRIKIGANTRYLYYYDNEAT